MYMVQEESRLVDPNSPEIRRKSSLGLMWFGIVSIIMLFAGLTSAYIVRQGEGKWVQFDLPSLFAVSTVILFISSLTLYWAYSCLKKGKSALFKTGMFLTLVLGTLFVVSQYLAWSELYHNGIVFTGTISDIKTEYNYIPTGTETVASASEVGNVAGSFLYVITGLHVLHVLAGMIALLVVFGRAMANRYSAANHNGVKLISIYWHFLDGLWLYLFFFLLYIR